MLTDVTHNSKKEADVARVMQNKNKKNKLVDTNWKVNQYNTLQSHEYIHGYVNRKVKNDYIKSIHFSFKLHNFYLLCNKIKFHFLELYVYGGDVGIGHETRNDSIREEEA